MKLVKNILTLLLAGVFLITSSGYIMYKSSCSCTGNEHTSVFVKPETCEDTFHKHHKHDSDNIEIACSAHECHECHNHTKSCGCDSPEIFFLKLKEKALDDDVKFIKVQATELLIASTDVFQIVELEETEERIWTNWTDPPPISYSSLDFLISIQQLKIPTLA